MDQFASQPSRGLIIVSVNIEDTDRRDEIVHRLINLPSEEITSTLIEVRAVDWAEGAWNEELEWFRQNMFGDDMLTIWQFDSATYSRYVVTAE